MFSYKAMAAVAVFLLGGVAASGQPDRVPGADQAGVAETKAMHADVVRAIEANTRVQIAAARLASQDARVAAVNSQVIDAQRAVWDAMKSRSDTQGEIRKLMQIQPGSQPQPRAATSQEVSEQQQVLTDRERQETVAKTRFFTLQKSLDSEQAKRTELSARLDEMERSVQSSR